LPDLPAWALPEGQKEQKGSRNGNGAGTSAHTSGAGFANGDGHGSSQGASTGNGTNDRGKVMTEIQQLSKSVGRKLLVHVLRTSAGVESVTQVGDPGKLKLVLDRLQNVHRGTQRLKAAVGTVGLEALREECGKLKMPSVTTDDIPDTNALHELIERLEARAKTLKGGSATEAVSAGNQQTRQAPASSELVRFRNELLSRARRLASQRKQSIEAVIAWASDGSLEYAKISQLGEADLPKVKAALQRLVETKA